MKKKNTIRINDIDIDTWLDRDIEKLDELPADETTLKYDKKLVAFLDLLGITNRILEAEDGQESEIIDCLEKTKGIVLIEAKEYLDTSDLNLLHLSDSFIFACSEELLPKMLDLLCIIQVRILIECHTMLRGALEYGSVIIKDDGRQIIGPAYISAYQRQERDAIYPRIIISNSVSDLINTRFSTYSSIIMSYDREKALDCVQAYCDREGTNKNAIISRLRREGVYDYLIEEYRNFHEKDRSSERRKYGWMINYLIEKEVWPNEPKYRDWQ